MKPDSQAMPLQIAKPCPKNWDEMAGDTQRRFCGHCQLHVHNLSAMPDKDREELIARSGERLCIAYELRPDGSVVTPGNENGNENGNGNAKWRWDWARRAAQPVRRTAAAVLATVMPGLMAACSHNKRTLMGEFCPPPGPLKESNVVKGKPVMMLGTPLLPSVEAKRPKPDSRPQ